MSHARDQLDVLQQLCTDVRLVLEQQIAQITYRAPIIDWHHPDDYRQQGVQGLRKFLSAAENERDHVDRLVRSTVPPKEITTNAPHLLAVWAEFIRAKQPLCLISQTVECGSAGQAKIDIIADGGNEWVKVNTIKAGRLLMEFREQDSYVNSDFDSDGDDSSQHDKEVLEHEAETNGSSAGFTNSLIKQGHALVKAAAAFPRAGNLATPRITYVLNRLEEHRDTSLYEDDRIPKTFAALRNMGINVRVGPPAASPATYSAQLPLVPTKRIMLDLSVMVALCCDTTHKLLPTNERELEARFRPLRSVQPQAKELHNGLSEAANSDPSRPQTDLELCPHTSTSSDLRDQLRWEMQHPLIQEMLDRLTPLVSGNGAEDRALEYWVIPEVRDRLPGIVDLIGGAAEKRRAKALFAPATGADGANTDFWEGSRWQGKEGVLRNLRVRVLMEEPAELEGESSTTSDAAGEIFRSSMIYACKTMLALVESAKDSPSPASSRDSSPGPNQTRRSRGPKGKKPSRPSAILLPGKLPTSHTLHTLLAGAERGWTVLTNNRGAVGKICREIGVAEGLPADNYAEGIARNAEADEPAAIWVVNPSSLSEWRRKEVEQSNEALLAGAK